jgi:hypothetical protein
MCLTRIPDKIPKNIPTFSLNMLFCVYPDTASALQAILLATGETEKLKPLTNIIPAPMIPLASRSYPTRSSC